MSLIHILDKRTGTILDDITEEYIIDNEHYRSLKDTTETFNFTTFADKRFSPHLEKRNRVIIPDEDRGYAEFIITNSIKIHEQDNLVETEVYSEASYLELKKSKVIEPQTLNEYTVSMHAGFALGNTSWQVGEVESNHYRTITIENHTNPYAYLRQISNEFDLELNFRIEVDGNRIVGRYVDLLQRIGTWRGVEVEFGTNLESIRRNEDTKNIVTALVGLGPVPQEDEDGNTPPRMEVFVQDNEALERWGFKDRYGNLRHLVDYYEVDSTDEDMTVIELEQYTRTELNKRINEVVEYEVNIHDLEHVPGLQNFKLRFGDTIRIKDTTFNPPLYLEARIHSQRRDIKDKKHKQVTLGDYTEYTEEEVTAIWRELQQEIQRKIDLYDLLEYTYDKETIDYKDEVVLGDGREYSRNVAKEAEDNAKEHAESVASEAERLAKEYAEREINASESRILEATVAKAVYEATIADIMSDLEGKASNSVVQDLQDEVATKVDGDWVEGRLATKADTDSVYTIEELDNMFDNVVSITEYTTDKQGFLDTFENHETRISQTETEITTKVERTEFEAIENEIGELGTSIENAWTQINQNADNIALKASQSSVDTLTKEVSDLEAELTIQAGKIASKVEQSEFDSVTNTLGNDISRVEQTAQGISQEVSSIRAELGDIEDGIGSIQGTLSSHNTRINQNAEQIELRATKSEVNTLAGRVTNAETAIQTNADEISLRATKTEVNNLAGRVSITESEISVLHNEVDIRVKENGVIAAINLSSESATINASRINLVGAVTVLSDITGNLGSITAGDITGVNITGATILQEGEDGSILLDNTGFHKLDADGHKRISISNENWEFQGFSPASIVLNQMFAIMEGGHGYGDAFIGYVEDYGVNRQFNITNDGGTLAFSANNILFQDQTAFVRPASSGGLAVAAGRSSYNMGAAHVITAHNINDYMVIYPQRYTGQDRFRIRSHNLRSDFVDDFRLSEAGTMYVPATYYNTTTNPPTVRVGTSAGHFTRSTSSRKAKLLIEPVKVDPYKLLEIEPKDWFDKGDVERYSEALTKQCKGEDCNFDDIERIRRVGGLIAEEVESAGLDLYVDYDEYGNPTNVHYDRLWTLAIPILKDHEEKLTDHEKDIDHLKNEIDWLEMENKLLKRRVEKLEQGVA